MKSSLVALVTFATGCSPVFTSIQPSASSKEAAEAQKMAQLSREANSEAERSCAPLKLQQTGWAEEQVIGKSIATAYAAKAGHFFIEGPDEPAGGKNAVSAHVAVVGRNLARLSSRPELPWVFGVIENDTPQSSNAPGGYVFVTTGLLKKLTNEAQLAGLLAHEIGHVTLKHGLAQHRENKHKQCLAAKFASYLLEHGGPRSASMDEAARQARSFDANTPTSGGSDFNAFMMNSITAMQLVGTDKQAELAADHAALELLSFAGYDAAEYEKALLAIGPLPQHPTPEERTAKLKALREGELRDFARGTAKPDLAGVFAPLNR